jgi:flagellar basal-body rod protein FlgG
MQIGMEASRNGILAQVSKQDLIANNLANITTHGFKRSTLTQTTFPFPGTRVAATPTDFTQGDLVPTDQDLDLAIDGDGFFTVERGGITAYTRAGNFHVDRDGSLVTAQGYPLDPPITLPQETERVEVTGDGKILSIQDQGATAVEVGRLEVVRFQNQQGLAPVGDNLYLEGPDSGRPLNGNFGEEGFPVLRSRTLEQSNANLQQEITDEIVTQRAFQANVRAFRASEQLIGEALDLFR